MNIEILEQGNYKGIEYLICNLEYNSLHSWNAAYIKMEAPDEEFLEEIPCNGGITFTGTFIEGDIRSQFGECIGWDYGHCWDYHPLYNPDAKKLSINDLRNDVEEVIDFIKENKAGEE